ncbi:MAG: hypothetical protein ACXWKC_16505 [Xanthobacteraceae bacterium]
MTMAVSRALSFSADRKFYTTMSVVMAAIVFAGFAPTYYLKHQFGAPPLDLAIHLHGLVFSTWIALFFTQTVLIANGRTDIHRKLGVFGAVLAALMVVLGIVASVHAIRTDHTPPGIDPRSFLVLPLFDIAIFAILVSTGVALRRQSETHKRLMLLSTICMLDAAIARLPGMLDLGPPAFFAIQDLLIVAGLIYDYVSRGRINRAYIWGGLLIILSQPIRLIVSGMPFWLAFGDWIKG